MINLAPRHKMGLNLAHPIMNAAGFGGYGKPLRHLFDLNHLAAIVTNPITLRPRRGCPQPRLAETSGGFILETGQLETGQQNPGVKKVIRQQQKFWSQLTRPLIVHLPADEPADLHRTARALANLTTPAGDPLIAAFELGLPHETTPDDVVAWLRAIQADSPQPVLVKLPVGAMLELAEAASDAGADGFVVGTPPLAAAPAPNGEIVTGCLYGAGLFNLVLREIELVGQMTDLPLVAAGGIHRPADIQAVLSIGARAVQLDSLLMVDPVASLEMLTAYAGA